MKHIKLSINQMDTEFCDKYKQKEKTLHFFSKESFDLLIQSKRKSKLLSRSGIVYFGVTELGKWYIILLLSPFPEFIITAETAWEIQEKKKEKNRWKAHIKSYKEESENKLGTSLKRQIIYNVQIK